MKKILSPEKDSESSQIDLKNSDINKRLKLNGYQNFLGYVIMIIIKKCFV